MLQMRRSKRLIKLTTEYTIQHNSKAMESIWVIFVFVFSYQFDWSTRKI